MIAALTSKRHLVFRRLVGFAFSVSPRFSLRVSRAFHQIRFCHLEIFPAANNASKPGRTRRVERFRATSTSASVLSSPQRNPRSVESTPRVTHRTRHVLRADLVSRGTFLRSFGKLYKDGLLRACLKRLRARVTVDPDAGQRSSLEKGVTYEIPDHGHRALRRARVQPRRGGPSGRY